MAAVGCEGREQALPTVAILILNYNGVSFVRNCLASVLDQSYPQERYSVVFIDNGSSDNSLEIVRNEFPTVQVLRHRRNLGFCQGYNEAIRQYSADYLIFLNMDTVVHKRWLEELVKVMESDRSIAAAHSNMIMPWVAEFALQVREGYPSHLYYYELNRWGFAQYRVVPFSPHPLPCVFVSGASFIIRQGIVAELGEVFDPDFFAYCEDLDFSLRLFGLGYSVVVVPTSVVYHVQGEKTALSRNSARTLLRANRNRVAAFYKNLSGKEFLLSLPLLGVGAIYKMWHLPGVRVSRGLAMIMALPLNVCGFLWGVVAIRQFAQRRRFILERRRQTIAKLVGLFGSKPESQRTATPPVVSQGESRL